MSEPSLHAEDFERLQQDTVGYFLRATDTGDGAHQGWLSPEHDGLDQELALLIEDHCSRLLRRRTACPAKPRGSEEHPRSEEEPYAGS